MAGNDVSFGGGSTTVPNYTGIIYAKGQCKISGSSGFYKITLLCRDDPAPGNEKDHFNTHSFGGSHSFQIDCDKLGPPSSGTSTVLRRRIGWSPAFGS